MRWSGLECNRIFCDLEAHFAFFIIFGPENNPGSAKITSFILTRRIDPRYPEGPWFDIFFGSRFCVLHF